MTTKTYTREELRAFEKELAPYRVTRKTAAGDLSYINFDQYLIDQHVCVRRAGDYSPAICNVARYQELTEKYDQLRTLKEKRAFAKEKEIEELEAMSS